MMDKSRVPSPKSRVRIKTRALFCCVRLMALLCVLAVPARADHAHLPYTIYAARVATTNLTADVYFPVGGSVTSATEANLAGPVPVNGVFKELRCRLNAANDSDESWTVSLRINLSSSALTCTIGASAQTCTDLVNSVPVSVGDTMDMLFDNTAGGSPSAMVACSLILYEYN